MRRLAFAVPVLIAVAAVLLAAGGGGGEGPRRYVVELDNALGMVIGGDVRVAGANAGRVVAIDLDRRTFKALVEVEIDETGFGSLRRDTFCETRPQSPLGEFFLDCLPGRSKQEIPPGGRVPVVQTASTIAPDLVTNIMRRPYRERFRLVLNEFGAGLAGRPQDLNETIRRSVPALRQTARLLDVLADHNRVISRLVTDADRVIGKLSDNRRDVGRFVAEAGETATASAERAGDIRLNFDRLPRFVRELTPTMAALEQVATEQRPLLVDLSASAGELERFFDRAADFATSSRPALRALGEVAPTGREAVRAALPQLRQLRSYAEPTTDLARNLRIVLEDFDDPARAVEPDPRSPGGRGFSGTQALLTYVFNQSLTNNSFDELGHMVRAAAHTDDCSPYQDAAGGRDPKLAHCRSWLGPTQPGVNAPDPSPPDPAAPTSASRERRARRQRTARVPAPALPGPGGGHRDGGGGSTAPLLPGIPGVPDIDTGAVEQLLDYLLAP